MYKDVDGGTRIVYGLIILAAFAGVYSIYKKKHSDRLRMEQAVISAQKKIDEKQALSPSEQYYLSKMNMDGAVPPPDNMAALKAQAISAATSENFPTPQDMIAQKSKQAIATFSQDAQISFNAPKSFNFHNLDLDPGMAGFYGENSFQKAKVTGLAYGVNAKPEQAVEFMKKEADNFPNLAKNPIASIGTPQKIPPPPGDSGFSGTTVWDGKLQNGEQFSAVMLNRADQKGTYLFVISGPSEYFDKNDGSFDSIYDNAKALSPAK